MAQSIEGGVVIVNTHSPKNNGSYPRVMANAVNFDDGTDLETKIGELGGSFEEITTEEIADLFA